MTVEELIAELQKYPKDTKVYARSCSWCEGFDSPATIDETYQIFSLKGPVSDGAIFITGRD